MLSLAEPGLQIVEAAMWETQVQITADWWQQGWWHAFLFLLC